jgi:hypothetical protein
MKFSIFNRGGHVGSDGTEYETAILLHSAEGSDLPTNVAAEQVAQILNRQGIEAQVALGELSYTTQDAAIVRHAGGTVQAVLTRASGETALDAVSELGQVRT